MAAKVDVFIVGPGLSSPSGASPGYSWVNKPPGPDGSPRGLPPGPIPSPNFYGIGSGFPVDMPKPVLLTENEHGRLPLKDFEPAFGDFWLLSEPAKKLLEETDSESFVFCPVEIRTTGAGRDPGPRRFCDVTRFLDAIDEESSTLRVTDYGRGRRLVQIENPKSTHFRRSRIGSAHVFRSVHNPECYCSSHFRDTVRSSCLNGLGFLPAGVLDA